MKGVDPSPLGSFPGAPPSSARKNSVFAHIRNSKKSCALAYEVLYSPQHTKENPRPDFHDLSRVVLGVFNQEEDMTDTDKVKQLEALATQRWRIALQLTLAMMAIYFGFILLVAYAKGAMGTQLVPGLSLGILLGALVIVAAWVLNWIYVRWANREYDEAIRRLGE